jgi:hypothetical protein
MSWKNPFKTIWIKRFQSHFIFLKVLITKKKFRINKKKSSNLFFIIVALASRTINVCMYFYFVVLVKTFNLGHIFSFIKKLKIFCNFFSLQIRLILVRTINLIIHKSNFPRISKTFSSKCD